MDPVKGPEGLKDEKDVRRKATMMMAGDFYEYFWTSKKTKIDEQNGFNYLYFLYSGDAEYANYGVPAQFEGPCGMQNVKHLFGDGADHQAALGFSAARMSYQLPTPLLRLADVYLVCAEAYLLSGNNAKALQYTNAVRERAHVDALASVKFEDIWKERRLELAGEGDRWYDYVRLAYYNKKAAMDDLKSQKMNSVYNYDEACKHYWYTGCGGTIEDVPKDLTAFDITKAEWKTDFTNEVRYNTDDPARSTYVNDKIFTLPLPSEDVVFNKLLLEEAKPVDVRTEYVYNF